MDTKLVKRVFLCPFSFFCSHDVFSDLFVFDVISGTVRGKTKEEITTPRAGGLV